MRRVFKISVPVFALLAALLAVLLYEGVLRFNYPGLDEFPVQGVDVSHLSRVAQSVVCSSTPGRQMMVQR